MIPALPLFPSLLSPIYSLRFVGVSWLHSGLTPVGRVRCDYSWHGIYPIGNGGSGIGTDFYLQKIIRQKYSPRQYQATGEVCCFGHTHSQTNHKWPDMGLSITHSKTIWTYYGVGSNFSSWEYSSRGPMSPRPYPVQDPFPPCRCNRHPLTHSYPQTHSHTNQNPITHYHWMPTSSATVVPYHRLTHNPNQPTPQTHSTTIDHRPKHTLPPLPHNPRHCYREDVVLEDPRLPLLLPPLHGVLGLRKKGFLGLRRGESSCRTKTRERREGREMKEREERKKIKYYLNL